MSGQTFFVDKKKKKKKRRRNFTAAVLLNRISSHQYTLKKNLIVDTYQFSLDISNDKLKLLIIDRQSMYHTSHWRLYLELTMLNMQYHSGLPINRAPPLCYWTCATSEQVRYFVEYHCMCNKRNIQFDKSKWIMISGRWCTST